MRRAPPPPAHGLAPARGAPLPLIPLTGLALAGLAAFAILASIAGADAARGDPLSTARRAHRGPHDHSRAPRVPRDGGVAGDAPSPDAVALGTLAPPTRLSTLGQTYGDAAYARARRRGEAALDGRSGEGPGGPGGDASDAGVRLPCDPRSAGAGAYRCGPLPAVPGYGLGYAYNPAYVSSPFSSGFDPGEQAPALPDVTSLFFAINGLAAGHGD